jgi:beta-lactamase class A
MVTKKILIYTAISSTLLGGLTTSLLINNKIISVASGAQNYSQSFQNNSGFTANTANGNNTSNRSGSLGTATNGSGNDAGQAADKDGQSNGTGGGMNYSQQDTQGSMEEGIQVNSANSNPLSYNALSNNCKIGTQKGYKLIKPMLWAKTAKESVAFSPLKSQIINLIENDVRQNILSSASVYLYSFADGDWTYINPNESYNPGSLIKVPMLITYLQMAERDPKILNKKILCENFGYIPTQTYETHAINPGRIYTVRELLHSMIAYSDNNATNLLNQNVDVKLFKKTFTDLNIPDPDIRDMNYQISAKRYSRFLIVLYNASYLSRSASESALQLLSECDFKEGMVKELPSDIAVAHKFGEWGNNKLRVHVLSESGIVYLNDRPYMLTVMTRGSNVKDLGPEISKISKMTYDFISSQSNPNL